MLAGTTPRPDRSPAHALDRILAIALAIAALAYLVYSFRTMGEWTPGVLYADQWRQYVRFLTVDFPTNVFLPDNGHRLLLPNIVAWIDATTFGGSYTLQLALGWGSILAAIVIAGTACLRDHDVVPLGRVAGATLAVFAIIWLGCVRTLAHVGELMHVYPTIAFTLGAIACAWRAATTPARSMRWLVAALLCGFAATNCFGYGLAAFVGIIVALVLARAQWRVLVAAVAGLGLAALYYFGSRGGDGVSNVLTVDPPANLLVMARWLGGPLNAVVPYVWYENPSYHLPGFTQPAARAFSAWVRANAVPDILYAVWPQALVGGAGIVLTIALSWRALRATQPPTRMRVFGLALAWFGIAAAGIVSLSRLAYFNELPIQIYADRYLPWPMLFWLGIALALLGGRYAGNVAPRVLAVAALGLLAVAQPAEKIGRVIASLVRGHVDNTAAGVATGVLPREMDLGETIRAELVTAVPVLKAADHPPFSWRETRALGAVVPDAAQAVEGTWTIAPVDNLFEGTGQSVQLALPAGATPPWRAVLVDAQRHAVGILVRDMRHGENIMSGYARGAEAPVAAVLLP